MGMRCSEPPSIMQRIRELAPLIRAIMNDREHHTAPKNALVSYRNVVLGARPPHTSYNYTKWIKELAMGKEQIKSLSEQVFVDQDVKNLANRLLIEFDITLKGFAKWIEMLKANQIDLLHKLEDPNLTPKERADAKKDHQRLGYYLKTGNFIKKGEPIPKIK